MSTLKNKLKALFTLSADPILGIEKGKIIFINPATQAMFGANIENDPANQHIPEHILDESSDCFVCAATIAGKNVSASVSSIDDIRLICISFEPQTTPTSPFVPPSLIYSLNSSLSALNLAASQLATSLEITANEKSEKYFSALFHSYYTLRRVSGNLQFLEVLTEGRLKHSPRVVDLNELCRNLCDSVSVLIGDAGPEFKYTKQDKEPVYALVDEALIEQLILNLISNSLLNTEKTDSIKIGLTQIKKRLIISVDDNGKGIDSELLPSVFSRFSRKFDLSDLADGIGMGLFISKSIAELHGGSMIIESRKGEGCSVRFIMDQISAPPTVNDTNVKYETVLSMDKLLCELASALDHCSYSREFLDF